MHVGRPSSSAVHQHLYKGRNSNWKNELRKSFMRRLHENRLKTFDRGRAGLERSRADLLIESSIQDEINALRLSEHVSADELDEAIEEFERFREELVQQEIDSMLAYEQERLESLATAYESETVLCPKCQLRNLEFPDSQTLCCDRCNLRIRVPYEVPTPAELTMHFTEIFTTHAERDCTESPIVQVEDGDKLFLRCKRCSYDAKIF